MTGEERSTTRAAFEAFFEAESERLFKALCIATRNRHEAEEIMQDAFLSMWKGWDNPKRKIDDPVAYLYRIAMNAFRSRLRRAAVSTRKAAHLIPRADGLDLVEEHDAVVRALAPLKPVQRAAIVLTNMLDFTSEEAGDMLGVSPGAVRTAASRARSELRRLAGESDE